VVSGAARPLRVLVLDHSATLGGGEIALLRLCGALGPDVDVRVLLFADGPLVGRLADAGVAVEVLPLARSVQGLGRQAAGRASARRVLDAFEVLRFTVRLARRTRALRPDVVHTTSLKADLLGVLPARVARRPLVWYVHDRIAPDYLPGSLVRLVRACSRAADVVLVNSRATAATLPVPTTVAYPGLPDDLLRAEPGDGEGRARPAGPGPTVTLVGRTSPTKGQRELVRAAPEILRRHPGARFRLVGAPLFGEEAYAEEVRAEAEELGVADRVTWVGFVADPTPELDRADVVVHASPVAEPFGQVVVEAMARGVPVVATRAGGVPEILEPDAGPALGVLVAPADPAALARGVLEVLDDPDAAAARAALARADVRTRFTASGTARVVTDAWRRAARGRRPAP